MKFAELRLLVAINELGNSGDPIRDSDRLEYAKQIRDVYSRLHQTVEFPWDVSDVIELATKWRKGTPTKLKADIAIAHGFECFWRERGKGPCSDEAEAGHILPASSGAQLSVANGLIECRAHNNQRRDRTIEEYLSSEDKTTAQ